MLGSGFTTTKDSDCAAEVIALTVTVIEMATVPDAVGVPEMRPVEVRLRPTLVSELLPVLGVAVHRTEVPMQLLQVSCWL